jgi:hypothetical protein
MTPAFTGAADTLGAPQSPIAAATSAANMIARIVVSVEAFAAGQPMTTMER